MTQNQSTCMYQKHIKLSDKSTYIHHPLCHNCLTCSARHDESEKRLPKSCLVVLCKFEPVLRWTRECDNLLYQTLVEILIPDVLRPIPSKAVGPVRGLLNIQKKLYFCCFYVHNLY